MIETRLYGARFAARRLLRKLYRDGDQTQNHDFLGSAPDHAATDLGLAVERVPAIPGGEQIAGVLDRDRMTIQIATKFHWTSQRFTLAHEIGHYFLHTGTRYFRDRESARFEKRDPVEAEADAFAAEFLMPRRFLALIFDNMFGSPVNGTDPCPDIMAAVQGANPEQEITLQDFVSSTPFQRAFAISKVSSYRGRQFAPLTVQFRVSPTAMGIQLVETGLVT